MPEPSDPAPGAPPAGGSLSSAIVFLLSCERSGSTLLRYILDTHPAICCPGELALGRLVQALRFTAARTFALTVADEAERDLRTRDYVSRVAAEFPAALAATRGKAAWCDKTPENVGFLDDIAWAFPDARYLCLYRRSDDVIYSCLDVSRDGFMPELAAYAGRSPHNLVAAMLESWVEKTERIVAFEAGHRCFRLHYEALVNDPPAMLGPLFAFLGFGWDPALLAKVFVTPHDPGGGDPKIRTTDRIDPGRVGKGAGLDPRLLAAAPEHLLRRRADLHIELGYPL